MTDDKFTYGLLRQKFITRDKNAVEDWNNSYGYKSIEAKIDFESSRLQDLCGVVMKLLEELDKEHSRNDQ